MDVVITIIHMQKVTILMVKCGFNCFITISIIYHYTCSRKETFLPRFASELLEYCVWIMNEQVYEICHQNPHLKIVKLKCTENVFKYTLKMKEEYIFGSIFYERVHHLTIMIRCRYLTMSNTM